MKNNSIIKFLPILFVVALMALILTIDFEKFEFAVNSENANNCSSISNELLKNECYYNVALETKNHSVCNLIKSEQSTKCIHDVFSGAKPEKNNWLFFYSIIFVNILVYFILRNNESKKYLNKTKSLESNNLSKKFKSFENRFNLVLFLIFIIGIIVITLYGIKSEESRILFSTIEYFFSNLEFILFFSILAEIIHYMLKKIFFKKTQN